MKSTVRILAILFALVALLAVALPAQANTSTLCTWSPAAAPVGTTFSIACSGYTPKAWVNVYATEPDGRASGINIYGFFPDVLQADEKGVVSFKFYTEFDGLFSVPPGNYTFVIQEFVPDGGGALRVENHVKITVQSSPRALVGAALVAGGEQPYYRWDTLARRFDFLGTGYVPFEIVNVWVTAPPGTECSGLGIDQLTLGSLGSGSSSLWFMIPAAANQYGYRDDLKADANGNIAFSLVFAPSACRGWHGVSARATVSGIGAETRVLVTGNIVRDDNASVFVSPGAIPAYRSYHTVSGSGFPAWTVVTCWYTRPDGRVLSFINLDVKTDASGSFSVANQLDDFPPYTSTEPGWWWVTCATASRSALGRASFLVYGLVSDP